MTNNTIILYKAELYLAQDNGEDMRIFIGQTWTLKSDAIWESVRVARARFPLKSDFLFATSKLIVKVLQLEANLVHTARTYVEEIHTALNQLSAEYFHQCPHGSSYEICLICTASDTL